MATKTPLSAEVSDINVGRRPDKFGLSVIPYLNSNQKQKFCPMFLESLIVKKRKKKKFFPASTKQMDRM